MFNMEQWTKEFFNKGNTPMSPDVSAIFLKMLLADRKDSFDVTPLKGEFLYQMIEGRAKYMGLELTNCAKVFLMFLCENPGTATMYLSALRSRKDFVTMKDLGEMFPMGFLSEADISELWLKQKGHYCEEKAGNCLDAYAWS